LPGLFELVRDGDFLTLFQRLLQVLIIIIRSMSRLMFTTPESYSRCGSPKSLPP
jgi:hypothetical protein